MFSLDFDSLFSTVDLKSFSHSVIDTMNLSYNLGVIVLVIASLKSLARLLPE